jgi:hypothetical protein
MAPGCEAVKLRAKAPMSVGRNHGTPSTGARYKGRRPAECEPASAGRGTIAMANILVNIEKGVEIAAEDALKWLSGANEALHAAPQVVAALATLIAAVEKPLAEVVGAVHDPLNIALETQTVTDLKTAWPAVKQFLGTLGVKF